MRLGNGTLWPIPVTLDLAEEQATALAIDHTVALRDPEGVMLAALHIEDIWRPDLRTEAAEVFGSTNREHPGVSHLLSKPTPFISAVVWKGFSYRPLRLSVATSNAGRATRRVRLAWVDSSGCFPDSKSHAPGPCRAHHRAAADREPTCLIHPVVGMTKPGDVDHYTRVRCYQAVLDRYPDNTATLALLPLAMRMGGPREAVWHAIIRKNYGCTHLVVGRDHAGPGSDSSGRPFYGPYDAPGAPGQA